MTIKTYSFFRKNRLYREKEWAALITTVGTASIPNDPKKRRAWGDVQPTAPAPWQYNTIGLGYALEHGISLVEAVAGLTEG